MPDELNKPRNEAFRAFDQYDKTTALTYLSILLIILSCVSLLVALMALNSAKDAKIRSEYQDREIIRLAEDIEVYRIRKAKLDAWLKVKGVPIEEIYE